MLLCWLYSYDKAHLGNSDGGHPQTQAVLVITAEYADVVGFLLDLRMLKEYRSEGQSQMIVGEHIGYGTYSILWFKNVSSLWHGKLTTAVGLWEV